MKVVYRTLVLLCTVVLSEVRQKNTAIGRVRTSNVIKVTARAFAAAETAERVFVGAFFFLPGVFRSSITGLDLVYQQRTTQLGYETVRTPAEVLQENFQDTYPGSQNPPSGFAHEETDVQDPWP